MIKANANANDKESLLDVMEITLSQFTQILEKSKVFEGIPCRLETAYGGHDFAGFSPKEEGPTPTSVMVCGNDDIQIGVLSAFEPYLGLAEKTMIYLWEVFQADKKIRNEEGMNGILKNDLIQLSKNICHQDSAPESHLEWILNKIVGFFLVDYVAFYFKEDYHDIKKLISLKRGAKVFFESQQKAFEVESSCAVGITFLSNAPFVSNDPKNDGFIKNEDEKNYANLFYFPVLQGNITFGVMVIGSDILKNISDFDTRHLCQYAFMAAQIYQKSYLADLLDQQQKKVQNLKFYVSENITNALMSDELTEWGEACQRNVIFLFADIRSFTKISENLDPKTLIDLLNLYFNEITSVIEEHHGTIDKLVGDMVAVLWNVPRNIKNPELHAVKTAVAMQKKMVHKVAGMWNERGVPRVGIGIGVASGKSCVGPVGSKDLMNFTALGDASWNAQKLESLARPGQILVTNKIYQKVIGQVPRSQTTINTIKLKGDSEAVHLLCPYDYPDY